jgi:hypothetical protein
MTGNVKILIVENEPGVFYNGTDTYGAHEEQHTYQGMILGPLYLPANGLGGLISIIEAPSGTVDAWHYNNFMENGPNSTPPRLWP